MSWNIDVNQNKKFRENRRTFGVMDQLGEGESQTQMTTRCNHSLITNEVHAKSYQNREIEYFIIDITKCINYLTTNRTQTTNRLLQIF